MKNQRDEAFTKKVAIQAKNGSLVGVTPLRLRRFEEHNVSLKQKMEQSTSQKLLTRREPSQGRQVTKVVEVDAKSRRKSSFNPTIQYQKTKRGKYVGYEKTRTDESVRRSTESRNENNDMTMRIHEQSGSWQLITKASQRKIKNNKEVHSPADILQSYQGVFPQKIDL